MTKVCVHLEKDGTLNIVEMNGILDHLIFQKYFVIVPNAIVF